MRVDGCVGTPKYPNLININETQLRPKIHPRPVGLQLNFINMQFLADPPPSNTQPHKYVFNLLRRCYITSSVW